MKLRQRFVLEIWLQIHFQVQGYQCKHISLNGTYYTEDAEICHCFENKCNTYIPDIPENHGYPLLPSVVIVLVAIVTAVL